VSYDNASHSLFSGDLIAPPEEEGGTRFFLAEKVIFLSRLICKLHPGYNSFLRGDAPSFFSSSAIAFFCARALSPLPFLLGNPLQISCRPFMKHGGSPYRISILRFSPPPSGTRSFFRRSPRSFLPPRGLQIPFNKDFPPDRAPASPRG